MLRPTPLLRLLLALMLALGALAAASNAGAQSNAAAPKPEGYLCPNATGVRAIDCFLNAIEHLYTMCRQVKSIEILEFGYEKSDEGVNGAKSGYCIDKHKLSMTRPYQAALREATGVRVAVDRLRGLHDLWLKSLVELSWKPGESDAEYKSRVEVPYATFGVESTAVRSALDEAAAKAEAAKLAKAEAAKARAAKRNKSQTSAATGAASSKPKSAN